MADGLLQQTQIQPANFLGAAMEGFAQGQNQQIRQIQLDQHKQSLAQAQREYQRKVAVDELANLYVSGGPQSADAAKALAGIDPERYEKSSKYIVDKISRSSAIAAAVKGSSKANQATVYENLIAPILAGRDPLISAQDLKDAGLPDKWSDDLLPKLEAIQQAGRQVENILQDPKRAADLKHVEAQTQSEYASADKARADTRKTNLETLNLASGGIATPETRAATGKNLQDYQQKVLDDVSAARATNQSLTALEGFLDGTKTGGGVQFNAAIKNFAKVAGFPVGDKELKNLQSAKAIINALVLPLTKTLGSGTGFSDKDREFLADTLPSLANTPGGNKQIIAYLRDINNRRIEVAKKVNEFRRQGIQDPLEIELKIQEWADENPLFKKNEGKEGEVKMTPIPGGGNIRTFNFETGGFD